MKIRARTLLAAGCGLVPPMLAASPAAATAEPTLIVESVCTTETPYAVAGRVTGFPSGERIAVVAVTFRPDGRHSKAGTAFETDANGASEVGSIEATGPFDLLAIFYRDRNANLRIDNGDEVIARFTAAIHEACKGTIAQPK